MQIWNDKKIPKLLSEEFLFLLCDTSLNNIFYSFYNPLKISILIIEYLTILSKKVFHHKNSILLTKNIYYKFSQNYVSEINDEKNFKRILRDSDLEGRRLIYIIYENDLWELIRNPLVEDVIGLIYRKKKENKNNNYLLFIIEINFKKLHFKFFFKDILWNGNIISNTSIFSLYSITQNVFLSKYNESCRNNQNYFLPMNTRYLKHHFALQKVVWTHSCKIRHFLDQIFIILLIISNLANFFQIRNYKNNLNNMEKLISIEKTFRTNIIFPLLFCINLPIRIASKFFYSHIQQINILIELEDLLDIFISLFAFTQIFLFGFITQIKVNQKILDWSLIIYLGKILN